MSTNDDDRADPLLADDVGELIRHAAGSDAIAPGTEARVRAGVETAWHAAVARRRRRRRGIMLAAAATLVLALGVAWLLRPGGGMPQPVQWDSTVELALGRPAHNGATIVAGPRRFAAGDTLETAAGERLSLTLGNGVSLRIDENTSFVFLGPAAADLRRGALYADAASGSAALRVETPYGVARDVGTQFEVRLLADAARISVREGRVVLTRDGARSDIGAGQGLVAARDGAVRTIEVDLHGPQWDWAERLAPAFPIANASLVDYLQWVARETGRELEFENDRAFAQTRGVTLHGDIAGLAPDESIDVVLRTTARAGRISVDPRRIFVAAD